MLKKILSAFLFLSIVCTGCAKKENVNPDTLSVIKNRDKMIVGVKIDTPPFGYLDEQNKNVGFDIDLAKLLAKRILGDEKKVEFVAVTPTNRILKLSSGEVDMLISTMSVTPQRQAILNFSIPYHTSGQAILVPNTSKISSIMELNNKKAIIVFGSTVEKNLQANVPGVTVIGYKTYPEAFRALKAGIADAMIADDTILMGLIMKDSGYKILPRRYTKEPYAIAFRKEPESDDLMEIVNIELKEAVNKGIIRQLKSKWGF